MQIDFHHGVIYILARLANFSQNEANIIAYSSQYVDEAIRGTHIRFANGAIYNPICSAHKQLDYRNFDELALKIYLMSIIRVKGISYAP